MADEIDDQWDPPTVSRAEREILRNQALMMMALMGLERLALARGALSAELAGELKEDHDRLGDQIDRLVKFSGGPDHGWIYWADDESGILGG
jgi:hypothetical protein